MRRSPAMSAPRDPRARPATLPALLPPVEGAALADGPGGVVLHLRASSGGVLRLPLSPDALREIAALATDALSPAMRRAGVH